MPDVISNLIPHLHGGFSLWAGPIGLGIYLMGLGVF